MPDPFNVFGGGVAPGATPIFATSAGAPTPAPGGVFGKAGTQAAEVLYEALGLKPTHGGYLPKGLSYAAPTYFLPQPIGFADPSAYGLHHDFLFGITYPRVAQLYTDPERLEREARESRERPHTPVPLKPIRTNADVGLFDVPFVIASGQLEFLAPPVNTGLPTPDQLTAQATEQRAFQEELDKTLKSAPPGLYPVIEPTGSQVLYEVTATGRYDVAGTFRLGTGGQIVVASVEPGSRLAVVAASVPSGSIPPQAIRPVKDAAITNARNAQGIRRDLVHERADP